MKKQGGFVPGIRPGKPTEEYLTKILNYIVFIGAIGLFFGALLAFSSIVFKVDKDERIDIVCECLPGANCGGCGYALYIPPDPTVYQESQWYSHNQNACGRL